jgi:uncharacterized coiled-coil protein SlyX
VGNSALSGNTSGSDNTAVGVDALGGNTFGFENTAVGESALDSNFGGAQNTAVGYQALDNNTGDFHMAPGGANTAIGYEVMFFNTVGTGNTAVGELALEDNTSGNANIAIGDDAGDNLTTGSNNIDIYDSGVADESNTIRIGTQGTQTKTIIAGISGATSASGIAVLINSSGILGTTTSSRRFKEDIKPMDKASEAILALKPVTFRYKKELDPEGIEQFGLVAEDVQKVNPALVALDKEGKPYAVRYEQVNAMLLNEFLKEHRKVQEQEAMITELKSTVALQQKGLQSVTTQLKEQASQIQKVSDQLELRKLAPQTVVNNQ